MNELTIVKNTKINIKKLIVYFFIYAFLGWILEVTYAFLVHRHFVNRGFLLGPLCPIYGLGAVILIISLNKVKGKPIQEFFIAAIAFTIFEYMASYILEVIFGLRWWDYSNDFMNLQGRVSIAYSIIWGAMGILLIDGIHPYITKKINNLKKYVNINIQNIILAVLVILIVIDFALSTTKYLK